MRRKLLHIILFLTASTMLSQAQDTDTLSVHDSVKEYYASIAMLPADTICDRVDKLIAQIDSASGNRAAAAGLAYDYYNSCPIMGTEAVSVYVAENYFLNGKLKWPDEATFPWLSTFVEFTKSSLLGRPAPELELKDADGQTVSFRNIDSPFKVLYFYEPGCSTCARYTAGLKQFLSIYDGEPLCLVAVNTANDLGAWDGYIKAHFDSIANPKVRVVNLWDPDAESLMHKKYGIFTTPMMYLMDNQNIIIGRKINAKNLSQLMRIKNKDVKDYFELYDKIFSNLEPVMTEDVDYLAKDLYKKVDGDTTLYREVFYNLFNYLRAGRQYALQQGALNVARDYIIGEPWYWSEEFIDRISYAMEKEKLNPVFSQAKNLLLHNSKGKLSTLYDECGPELTLVFFHLVSCEECEAMTEELLKIKSLLNSYSIRVVAVYTGKDEKLWKEYVKKGPKNWRYLWDKNGESEMHRLYDLEYVPHLYLLDYNKTIIAKDIDAGALKELLKQPVILQ